MWYLIVAGLFVTWSLGLETASKLGSDVLHRVKDIAAIPQRVNALEEKLKKLEANDGH